MDTGTGGIVSASTRMTLGVNSFLWHAALDTLRFLPPLVITKNELAAGLAMLESAMQG